MSKKFDLSVVFRVTDKITRPVKKITKSMDGMTKSVKKLGGSADLAFFKLDTGLRKLDRRFEKAGQRIERSGFTRIGNRMKEAGSNLTTRLTLPLTIFGGLAIRTASDFQSSMNMVGAVTKTTGTPAFEKLNDLAKELGATTRFSASEAAEGMKFLGMATGDANMVMESIPKTLELAAAAQIDLATASDIVTNIMSGYGKKASELGAVNDVLVNAFTSSNVNLQQLGESFKYAGAVAKGAGFSFKDTATFLGMLGSAGIQGSMAGTALKNVISVLESPTKKERKEMQRLGVAFDDLYITFEEGGRQKKKLKPLMEILEKFREVGLTSGEALEIFAMRGGPGMAALLGQGKTSLTKLRSALDETGTAARIAKVMMSGLPGALKLVASTFEAVQIAITESGFGEFIENTMRSIAGFMQRLSKTSPTLLAIVSAIAVVVAVAGPLVMLLGAFSAALGVLGISAAPFYTIIAAILALIAVVALLAANWDDVTEAFNNFLDGVKEGIENLKTLIPDLFKDFKYMLPDFLKKKLGMEITGSKDLNDFSGLSDTSKRLLNAGNESKTEIGLKVSADNGLTVTTESVKRKAGDSNVNIATVGYIGAGM